MGFQTLDGATVTGGNGRVLIDTRGMFELQATATIVGILDADLLLRVAWNPLDVLLEAGVSCCGGLISGGLRMHAWIGQGWQNKYAWLPDNDDFHFTGSIEATLKIPEGYIGDIGIAELPPFELSRGHQDRLWRVLYQRQLHLLCLGHVGGLYRLRRGRRHVRGRRWPRVYPGHRRPPPDRPVRLGCEQCGPGPRAGRPGPAANPDHPARQLAGPTGPTFQDAGG